jgi:hypothetical protein
MDLCYKATKKTTAKWIIIALLFRGWKWGPEALKILWLSQPFFLVKSVFFSPDRFSIFGNKAMCICTNEVLVSGPLFVKQATVINVPASTTRRLLIRP